MSLIIVESPTKAKTISQFLPKIGKELGEEFQIESSNGHIRDLPRGKMGIDFEDFEPQFVIPTKCRKRLTLLKKLSQKAGKIILAADEDREGESIAWHILEALKKEGLKSLKYKRIAFHEITEEAILEALKNPRRINLKLVDAQKARRVLDRIVGYELSPFLWKKFYRGLSAGRVQSIALRLIIDREREIEKFIPQEYWTIEGEFSQLKNQEEKQSFLAKLIKINDKTLDKFEFKNKKEVEKIIEDLKDKKYQIEKITKKEVKKYPLPPFATSSLQQEASNRFGFSAKKTMFLAQQLYEGIKLENGSKGLITYPRTDSFNLAEKFLIQAKNFIEKEFGKNYSLETPRFFKTKSKLAQEAHEAIRPTEAERTPQSIQEFLDKDLFKLYELIWKRGLACQMQEALFDSTTIDVVNQESRITNHESEIINQESGIRNQKYLFRASESVLKFDGFLKVYPEKSEGISFSKVFQNLLEEKKLKLVKVLPGQHFTEPASRYTDASLIKTLEEFGIGRPSTYAPIISVIQERGYVEKQGRNFFPKEIGFLVNDLLIESFPKIVEIKFTATIEEDLDRIARGRIEWKGIVKKFYIPFKKELSEKEQTLQKIEEKTDKICQKCGGPMIIKYGRFGKFLACSKFPECKNALPLDDQIGDLEKKNQEKIFCEKCNSEMILRPGRFGLFLGCSAYPNCKNIKSINKKLGIKCPKCQKGEIIERRTKKRRIFYGCDQYPACDFALWKKPVNQLCPKCNSLMVEGRVDEIVCSNKECK